VNLSLVGEEFVSNVDRIHTKNGDAGSDPRWVSFAARENAACLSGGNLFENLQPTPN
jgi:hypothetical protein